MDIIGVKSFKDLFLTAYTEPECMDSNERLDKLFDKAVEHYPILVNALLKYINNDEDLPSYYDNNFSYKKDYKDIPVLKLDDEHKYMIDKFQN